MTENGWPRIAVMGAGAVGSYFGGMMARAGAAVTLIGRAAHAEAIARQGLLLDSVHFRESVTLRAGTAASEARDADLVLFCVKSFDTEVAAQALAPHLRRTAVLLSLQNGVDNAARIHAAAGIDATPAVVYVAAEMPAPGRVRHTGRGDLVIGEPAGGSGRRDLAAIAATFERAGVPCRVSEHIETDLWTKMVMNCAYNAISAICQTRYGALAHNPWTRELMKRVTEEAVAIARASGVEMEDANLLEAVWQLGKTMSQALSSTAQDIARGKRTEIESLNGYLVRRGGELGVAAPCNRTLHALVKLLEESAPHAVAG